MEVCSDGGGHLAWYSSADSNVANKIGDGPNGVRCSVRDRVCLGLPAGFSPFVGSVFFDAGSLRDPSGFSFDVRRLIYVRTPPIAA
jgi:hypothetical protein